VLGTGRKREADQRREVGRAGRNQALRFLAGQPSIALDFASQQADFWQRMDQ